MPEAQHVREVNDVVCVFGLPILLDEVAQLNPLCRGISGGTVILESLVQARYTVDESLVMLAQCKRRRQVLR